METASLDSPECPESEPPPPPLLNRPAPSLVYPSSASQAPCRPLPATTSTESTSCLPRRRPVYRSTASKWDRVSSPSLELETAGGGRAARAQRVCLSSGTMGGMLMIGCSTGTASRMVSRRAGEKSSRARTTIEDEDLAFPATSLPCTVLLQTISLASHKSDLFAMALPVPLLQNTHIPTNTETNTNHCLSPNFILHACVLCLIMFPGPQFPLVSNPCSPLLRYA